MGVISEPGYIDNMIAFIITYILHLYTHDGVIYGPDNTANEIVIMMSTL
jgi:hypothetical protein